MRRVTTLIAALCLVLALCATAQAERRVALVIGNGAYKAGPLKNPPNDARDMAATLKSLGFDVILRENASLRQMNEAIDQFWGNLKKGGVGLFFFAGHGLQVGGENYLVPVDAKVALEKDVQYECVNAGKVLGRMEDAGNGLNIVILDACRNNPFARSFRSDSRGLAKMDAPTGSLVAFATAPGDVAADGEGRNGLYTSHLLRHLRTPGLTIENVLKRTRIGVAEESAKVGKKQTPWESSSLMGDFYFMGGAGQQPKPVAQQAALAPQPLPAPVPAPAPVAAPAEDMPLQAAVLPASSQPAGAADLQGRKRTRIEALVQAQAAAAAQQQTGSLASLDQNLGRAGTQAALSGQPRAWLGLRMRDADAETVARAGLGQTAGVLVEGVLPGSPAETAGFQAGDVVSRPGGQALKAAELSALVAGASPGDVLRLERWRQGLGSAVQTRLTAPPAGFAGDAGARPAQVQGVSGLTLRLIYTQDMLSTAEKVRDLLQSEGMSVQMFRYTPDSSGSYRGFIGNLYTASGYDTPARRVVELVAPYQALKIWSNAGAMSNGQQFNLWIAR